MGEIWRDVVGFEERYEVSSGGRIRSKPRVLPFKSRKGTWHVRQAGARFLTEQRINSGYLVVHFWKDDKRTVRTVHSVVAAAFIGPRPARHDVAHWNGDKTDNRAANLRYATRRENHADKIRHHTQVRGSRVPGARLTEKQIPELRRLYGKVTGREAAKRFGVSPMTVWRIWYGETWTHV